MLEQRKPILLLRWLLTAAVAYLLFVPSAGAWTIKVGLVATLVISNLTLTVAAERWWNTRYLQPGIFLVDTVILTAALYWSGTASTDFFLAYFVVLAVVAVGGGDIRWAALGGVAVVGAYGGMLYAQFGRDFWTSPYLLGRLPFLFVVATLYGTLTEMVRRRRHDARLQSQLTSWIKKLSTSFADEAQAQELTQHVLSEVSDVIPGTFRASLLRADADDLEVMFSSDARELRDLSLDPDRYPELRSAVLSGEPMVIEDLSEDPRTARVREHVRHLPFSSLLVCPVDLDEEGEHHLLFRVARLKGGFTDKEQEVCQQLAAAVANLWKQASMREEVERSKRLQMLSQMASGVSHDFNNVLCSILMSAEFLREEVTSGSDPSGELTGGVDGDRLAEGFDQIVNAAKDGMTIVDRLASWSRMQHASGSTPDEIEEIVDPAELLRQAWRHAEPRWAKLEEVRDLEVRWTTAESLPPVRGNPTELREALLNVILNAIDAMPQGGTLTLGANPAPTGVELVVRDTGVGIPEELHDRVFDPLFTTKGRAGTGLGLSLARSVVRRHGGDVELVSTEGVGSEFRMILPDAESSGPREIAEEASEAPSLSEQPSAATDAGPAGRPEATEPRTLDSPSTDAGDLGRVLVVEDNDVVRDIVVRFLEASGYLTDAVGSAREAEVLLGTGRTYVGLVLDVNLPGGNSPRLFDSMRQRRRQLLRRSVFYSSEGAPAEVVALTEEFDIPFVRKVEGLSALGEAVDGVVERPDESTAPENSEERIAASLS